jgi:hypothetical protein
MAPRVVAHPGTWPTATTLREVTVDSPDSSPSGHPSPYHDDTIEAHYASLERGIPCACYGGVVYIGHLVEGEDGKETEVFETVSCRRCADSR